MSDPAFCFPSNPDISGIGVRVAIYAQSFLSLVPAFFTLVDKRVTRTTLDTLAKQSATVFITAFAVLVSTIVQASTRGLTNLHTFVILNLSWLCNTNFFVYFLLYFYYRLHRLGEPEETRRGEEKVIKKTRRGEDGFSERAWHNGLTRANGLLEEALRGEFDRSDRGPSVRAKEAKAALRNPVFIFGTAHLTAMAAVGIWFWYQPISFSTSPACSQSTWVFPLGYRIQLVSEQLKGLSIFFYSLLLIPVFNLILPAALIIAPSYFQAFMKISGHITNPKPTRGLFILGILNFFVILGTEVTLWENSPKGGQGNANWAFGQTLALLLLLVPLRGAVKIFTERRPERLEVSL